MIGAASDLNENINKTQAIFGSASAKIIKDADAMAEAFGVSKNQFLDAEGRIGGLFKGAGFGTDATAQLSSQFVKLAGDASSFFNVDFDTAFQKIRSGLSGESEPLKDFGILMNEDMVKAKALEMGLVKTGQELSNQAKVAARAQIIMQGLGDAQGDLARTADGFANSSREATGRIENLAASIGETLLPIVGGALSQINQGIEALSLAWGDNKQAALDWAAGTVGGAQQSAESMGWLQKAVGKVADAFQLIQMGWKLAQSYITAGVGHIIDRIGLLFKNIDYLSRKAFGKDTGLGKAIKEYADGFAAISDEQMQEFNKMALAPDASNAVNQYFDQAKAKIDGLRKEMAKPAATDFSKLDITGKDKDKKAKAEKAFGAATVKGSAEAASITLRSRFGDAAGKTQDQIAKNTREANGQLGKIAATLEKIRDAAGSSKADIYALDSMV
jgi:hypothetical protein